MHQKFAIRKGVSKGGDEGYSQFIGAAIWLLHAVARLQQRKEVSIGDGGVRSSSQRHKFEDAHPKRPPASERNMWKGKKKEFKNKPCF